MAADNIDRGPYRRHEPARQYFAPGPPFQQHRPANQPGGWGRHAPMQHGGPMGPGPRMHGQPVQHGRHGPMPYRGRGRGRGGGGGRGGFRKSKKRAHNEHEPSLYDLEADNRRKAQRHFQEHASPSPGPTLLEVPKAPVNTNEWYLKNVGPPRPGSPVDSLLHRYTPNPFAEGQWWQNTFDYNAENEKEALRAAAAAAKDKDLAFFGTLGLGDDDEEDSDEWAMEPGVDVPRSAVAKAEAAAVASAYHGPAASAAGSGIGGAGDAGDDGEVGTGRGGATAAAAAARVLELQSENEALRQEAEGLNLRVLNLTEKLALAEEELGELRAQLRRSTGDGSGYAGDGSDELRDGDSKGAGKRDGECGVGGQGLGPNPEGDASGRRGSESGSGHAVQDSGGVANGHGASGSE